MAINTLEVLPNSRFEAEFIDSKLVVTPLEMPIGCYTIIAFYKNDMLSESSFTVYDGGYKLEFTPTKDYDYAKVFAFTDLDKIMPVCDGFKINK